MFQKIAVTTFEGWLHNSNTLKLNLSSELSEKKIQQAG